jgi:hypothetical protein
MTGKISKRTVDAMKPGVLLWDRDLRGFAARRRASDAAVYLVKYRTAGGRQRWYRIGPHGSPWTPDTARAEALQVLAAVGRGRTRPARRASARTAATMGTLFDRFLSDHVETKLRPSTQAEYRKTIAAVLRPALGPLPVATVTSDDVSAPAPKDAATPVHANRPWRCSPKVLHMAEQWGLRPSGSNPARGIQKYRGDQRRGACQSKSCPGSAPRSRRPRPGRSRSRARRHHAERCTCRRSPSRPSRS